MRRSTPCLACLGLLVLTGIVTTVGAEAQTSGNLPEAALLSVAILPFEPAVDRQRDLPSVVALREAEGRYVAFSLRRAMAASAQWGPVRLVPEPDPLFELQVTGRIVRSTPTALQVVVRAEDAAGHVWLEQAFTHGAQPQAYAEASAEPFAPLYAAINQALIGQRDGRPVDELATLQDLAPLRHAASLAPAIFDGYVVNDESGLRRVNRLPAREDPLWARVERIRQAQELFADAVDQHYQAYGREMQATYTAWRRINLESQATLGEFRRLEARRDKPSARQRYNALREVKYREQTLRESLAAFQFEVGETTLELDGRMVNLSGTLEEQQARWGEILTELFRRETGLP